jgi:hypothetical protein
MDIFMLALSEMATRLTGKEAKSLSSTLSLACYLTTTKNISYFPPKTAETFFTL